MLVILHSEVYFTELPTGNWPRKWRFKAKPSVFETTWLRNCYTVLHILNMYISYLAEKNIVFFHKEEFAKRAVWKAEFLCADTL